MIRTLLFESRQKDKKMDLPILKSLLCFLFDWQVLKVKNRKNGLAEIRTRSLRPARTPRYHFATSP